MSIRQREAEHTDVVVVGPASAARAALRLTEKGYRVGVLEAGRRFADDELPETSWDVRRSSGRPRWAATASSGSTCCPTSSSWPGPGVGGGSLNYANTLYQPPAAFFEDPQWARHHRLAGRAGAVLRPGEADAGRDDQPDDHPADDVMREVAEDMGVGDTFTSTPVGVFFGEPGETVARPVLRRRGPRRTGCTECGPA